MAELLPPSRKRVRAAWAVGLRPRSRLLVLGGIALVLASALELTPVVAGWLSHRLVLAFDPGSLTPDRAGLAAGSGAALLALLGIGVIAAVGLGPRGRARRALGVAPQAEQLPGWLTATLILLAVATSVAINRAVLAGAARSVDASPEALAHAWSAWVRHGLLGLAVAAVSVGVIELLISGRRLWRALHQTPAQARLEARADSRRAPPRADPDRA